MAIPDVDVNALAVLVAAVIQFAIGSLWYSNILFGNAWMRYLGIDKKKLNSAQKKSMTGSYILVFVGALVLNFVLAYIVKYMTASTFEQGMVAGLMVWIGFILTSMLGMTLWEGKSYKLYLINVFYYLVSLLITGGLLASWH